MIAFSLLLDSLALRGYLFYLALRSKLQECVHGDATALQRTAREQSTRAVGQPASLAADPDTGVGQAVGVPAQSADCYGDCPGAIRCLVRGLPQKDVPRGSEPAAAGRSRLGLILAGQTRFLGSPQLKSKQIQSSLYYLTY